MSTIALIVLIILGFLAVSLRNLRFRVSAVETELSALRAQLREREDEYGQDDVRALPSGGAPEPTMAGAEENEDKKEPPSTRFDLANVSSGPEPAAPREPIASTPAMDVESLVGGRWAVWVGALALAMGGVFLVRYSIERGYFGPLARIASGLAFSGLLVAGGEYLRRRLPDLRLPAFEQAPVAALLTAVGTMSAFGTLYAAHAFYGLLSPGSAFVALALVGFGAILAAGLHGPWLAGLGLLGALVTPLLARSAAPDLAPLVAYLAVVAAAGYATAILRGWAILGRASLIGIVIWGVLLLDLGTTSSGAMLFFLLLQMALAGFAIAFWPYRHLMDAEAFVAGEALGALAALAGIAMLTMLKTPYFPVWGSFMLVLLLLGLAWRIPVVAGATWLAGCLALVQLVTWPALPTREVGPVLAMPLPDSVQHFSIVAGLFGLAIGAVSGVRLKRAQNLPTMVAALYAVAGVVVPLLILVLVWLRVRGFGLAPEFGLVAGALALLFSWASMRFRVTQGDAAGLGVEAYAAGAIAALALGLTMVLDRGYLTVSLALAAMGAAWVTSRGPVQALRAAAGVLAGIVLVRIVLDPAIMAGNPGSLPVFNWLLFGYGVPALSFMAAARLLRPGGQDLPLRLMEGMAVLFVTLLVTFEIRHWLHGAALLTERTSHLELGLHLTASAVIAGVLMRLDALDSNPVFRGASFVLALASAGVGVVGLVLRYNPVLVGDPVVGGPILNSLILGYALPAAALGGVYVVALGRRESWFMLMVGSLSLAMAFLYVSLEVRRLFHGANISFFHVPTDEAELWTYSAVWLVLGILLLALGILRNARGLRLVSGGFIVPSILKVFLIDMSGLEGAWRALSFIGLGATLIGIGLVYQRFVFDRPKGDAAAKT